MTGEILGHPGSARQGEGEDPRACLGQQKVYVTVVTPLKLHDLIPSRVAPGQTQGTHGGLGTGVDKPHHLYGRHGFHHPFGQLHLQLRGSTKAGALSGHLGDEVHHLGMGMAQDKGTPGSHVIYVLLTVHVPQPGPLAPGHEKGSASHGLESPHRTVHTSGKVFACLVVKLLGSGSHGSPSS